MANEHEILMGMPVTPLTDAEKADSYIFDKPLDETRALFVLRKAQEVVDGNAPDIGSMSTMICRVSSMASMQGAMAMMRCERR